MGRRPEQVNLYARADKKQRLREASKRTGLSMSKIVFDKALPLFYNNPKELEDLAEEDARCREIQEAKEQERKTGDYLGSFDKMEDKIKRIKEKVKKGDISEETGDLLIRQTRNHYELTQRNYEEDILKKKEPKERKLTLEEARAEMKRLGEEDFKKRWNLTDDQLDLVKKYSKDEGISLDKSAETLIGEE